MKTIVCSAQPYALELVMRLRKSCGLVPVYWFTNDQIEPLVKENFQGSICHDYHAVIKGVPAPEFSSSDFGSLDLDLLAAMQPHEATIIEMMNRNDAVFDRFSYNERRDAFLNFLRYWTFVIKKCEVDAVLFEEEPHQASDYVLYLVAKYKNISTFLQIRTISKLGLIPTSDIFRTSPLLEQEYTKLQKYRQPGSIVLPPVLADYFKHMGGAYKQILKEHLYDQVEAVARITSRQQSSMYGRLMSFMQVIKRRFKNIKLQIGFLTGAVSFNSDQKVPGQLFSESKLKYARFLIFRYKLRAGKKNNLQKYQALASQNLDLTQKYIFVGLQFQPEKSTCPLAGPFSNQLLIIETLLKYLPDKWSIIVKEHPSQFVESYSRYGDKYRSYPFYERLASYENVKLAPIDAVPFELIDQAEVVASAGGTLCWEAVCRGKPAMTFANCWFQSCHGVHLVKSQDDVRLALAKIQASQKVDVDLVKLFALAVNNLGVLGAVGGPFNLGYIGVSVLENAKYLEKGILKLMSEIKAN